MMKCTKPRRISRRVIHLVFNRIRTCEQTEPEIIYIVRTEIKSELIAKLFDLRFLRKICF